MIGSRTTVGFTAAGREESMAGPGRVGSGRVGSGRVGQRVSLLVTGLNNQALPRGPFLHAHDHTGISVRTITRAACFE